MHTPGKGGQAVPEAREYSSSEYCMSAHVQGTMAKRVQKKLQRRSQQPPMRKAQGRVKPLGDRGRKQPLLLPQPPEARPEMPRLQTSEQPQPPDRHRKRGTTGAEESAGSSNEGGAEKMDGAEAQGGEAAPAAAVAS